MKDKFLDIYDQYFHDVYRYVFVKTGSRWDTEDLVSEIFRKAYEKFDGLRSEVNRKAWLMTISHNTVIDFYRAKKPVSVGDGLELMLPPYIEVDSLQQQEERICIEKSLNYLDSLDAEIIMLRYFSEMKCKEVGEVLGMSEANVRTKTSRIKKKLSILLSKCLGEQ
ncbi:RNA polymerase sigma factor [Brevibacillus daliensis]|uniref:RNA polymerase sigma factor n=1 Tax=Brevibacillus daliensis TaxID=2892995 RepID=UPI001E381E97|nr:sigma-70 family RNA polymerase sigma factor [Brevibacillus daliensis]